MDTLDFPVSLNSSGNCEAGVRSVPACKACQARTEKYGLKLTMLLLKRFCAHMNLHSIHRDDADENLVILDNVRRA